MCGYVGLFKTCDITEEEKAFQDLKGAAIFAQNFGLKVNAGHIIASGYPNKYISPSGFSDKNPPLSLFISSNFSSLSRETSNLNGGEYIPTIFNLGYFSFL